MKTSDAFEKVFGQMWERYRIKNSLNYFLTDYESIMRTFATHWYKYGYEAGRRSAKKRTMKTSEMFKNVKSSKMFENVFEQFYERYAATAGTTLLDRYPQSSKKIMRAAYLAGRLFSAKKENDEILQIK